MSSRDRIRSTLLDVLADLVAERLPGRGPRALRPVDNDGDIPVTDMDRARARRLLRELGIPVRAPENNE